jgi:hypothetical protein
LLSTTRIQKILSTILSLCFLSCGIYFDLLAEPAGVAEPAGDGQPNSWEQLTVVCMKTKDNNSFSLFS